MAKITMTCLNQKQFNMTHIDWEEITQEWFSKLDKGYAQAPYSKHEVNVLNEVLIANGMKALSAIEMQSLMEQEETEPQPEPQTEPQTRFHLASAEFMNSAEEFATYMKARYVEPGREIRNLEALFAELKKMPEADLQPVAKIIGENTNRRLENGTFKIGKYEEMLLRAINVTVRIKDASPFQLFYAILFNGTLQGNVPGGQANVAVEGTNGVLLASFAQNELQSIGVTSKLFSQLLDGIMTVYKLSTGKQLSPNLNSIEVNAALDVVQSESGTQLINSIISTEDSPTQQISPEDKQKVMQMLQHTSVEQAADIFIGELDSQIRSNLKRASYWATMTPEGMSYIKPIARIYKKVKPNKRTLKIPTVIQNFANSNINVQSEIIKNTLLEFAAEDVDTITEAPAENSETALSSPGEFEQFIIDTYAEPGQSIDGLTGLHRKIVNTSDKKLKTEIIDLIFSPSRRQLASGSFRMSQAETVLFKYVIDVVRVKNGHPSELWFALIFDGKVKGGVAGDTGITSDVDVDTAGVSLKSYSKLGTVDFGSIPVSYQDELKNIISISEIITGKWVNPSVTRGSLEAQFALLSSTETIADINSLINLSQTTSIRMIQTLGEKLNTILDGKRPDELVFSFITTINNFIREKIEEVEYWGIIIPSNRMVHLSPSAEIYSALESDPSSGKLSTGIIQFKGNKLYINGNKIHAEIID
jgi:hypothetical protein